jgi:hypothetical protein
MLDGIRSQEIIVGDYSSRTGGVCPMLAAHRAGARSDVRDFARAWDALGSSRRVRAATRRELDVLGALLQEGVEGSPATAGVGDGQAGGTRDILEARLISRAG